MDPQLRTQSPKMYMQFPTHPLRTFMASIQGVYREVRDVVVGLDWSAELAYPVNNEQQTEMAMLHTHSMHVHMCITSS